MTRETVYVAMTRGRAANHAYVCTDIPETEPHQHHQSPTARQVLTGVLARTGSEPSAHARIAAEQDRYGGIAQLTAEYETIAAAAQRPRWTRLIQNCGLTDDQAEQIIASDAFGPLCAALRRAEAHHVNPARLLPRLIAARPLDDTGDIAAVLHHRVGIAMSHLADDGRLPAPRLIAGLIPHAADPMTEDARTALDERQQLIQHRAVELARTALVSGDVWTDHLGPPPADPQRRRAWSRDVVTIAAYRDRHAITGDMPLGPRSPDRQPDWAQAAAALRRAQQTAATDQRQRLGVKHDGRRTPDRRGPSM